MSPEDFRQLVESSLSSGEEFTELARAEQALRERVKEITCLYEVSLALRECDSIESLFQEVASTLPSGWQYPEITRCRIRYDGEEYLGDDFQESEWCQESDIVVAGRPRGSVQIYYLEERATGDDGPFLKEERDLLDGIVRTLGSDLERRIAEKEVREGEARFTDLFASNMVGILFWDWEGNITDANDAFLGMVGYTREEVQSGKARWVDMTPEEHRAKDEAALAELATKRVCAPLEKEYIRKDGSRVPIIVAAALSEGFDDRGVAFILDITERRAAEEELNRHRDRLEEEVEARTASLNAANYDLLRTTKALAASNRELEAFAYSVSHDLRSPLRAINGFSKILLDEKGGQLDDEGQRLLCVVRENTAAMAELIDGLLELSRVVRAELESQEIDMGDLVGMVVRDLEATDPNPDRRIEVDPLPAAHGDPMLLRQVWTNLLANAAKFSRKSHPSIIEIRGSVVDGECLYEVRDNGAGFDMEFSSKLFGVFERLHLKEEFDGSGVGLAIVKQIVEKHGGSVWGEGEVGGGATLRFTLPSDEGES